MTLLFILVMLLGIAGGIYGAIGYNRNNQHIEISPSKAIPGFAVTLIAFLMLLSFTTVPAGNRAVITRFGNVNRTLDPGGHLLMPFGEDVHLVSTQTQTVKPSEDAASSDLQIVHTEVTLAYHYEPNKVDYIYSQLGGNAEQNVIVPAILEAIKSVTAKYPAADLISKRPEVRDGIENFVKIRLAPYHVAAENVSITNFHFSKDYENAIEAKVTAIQRSEQASNDLNRIKIEAEQKVAAAQGEAAALRAQKEQITPELLQLRTIEMMKDKWDGHLPENYYGGTAPLPMVDVFKKK